MNEHILSKLDYFLFFFRMKNLARQSGCGFSLKTGVEIISVIQLIYNLVIFTGKDLLIGTTFKLFEYINYVSLILIIVGSLALFLSSNSKSLRLGYYGYVFYSIEIYLSIMLYFVWTINKIYEIYFISSMGFTICLSYIFVVLIYFGIITSTKLYFLWIIFSFVKYFAKGDINVIYNISLNDYISIDNRSNPDPSRM
jgi:hypothetical protein